MRYVLVFFAFLIFSLPVRSGQAPDDHWICSQVGTMQKSNVLFLSTVFSGEWVKPAKEEVFSKVIQKITKGSFSPEFDPICRSYPSRKWAKEKREEVIKKAKKRKFRLFDINLSSRR